MVHVPLKGGLEVTYVWCGEHTVTETVHSLRALRKRAWDWTHAAFTPAALDFAAANEWSFG